MSKTNWRVVIYLRERGDFGNCSIGGLEWDEQDAIGECEDMRREVLRHVDVGGRKPSRLVRVEWDEEAPDA